MEEIKVKVAGYKAYCIKRKSLKTDSFITGEIILVDKTLGSTVVSYTYYLENGKASILHMYPLKSFCYGNIKYYEEELKEALKVKFGNDLKFDF